jgi:hypothetical protein
MSGQSRFEDLEPLLERVSKPIQYVGGELNSQVKDWECGGPDTVRWALMYPDAYEVGLPNQGVMILYEVLNERADALAGLFIAALIVPRAFNQNMSAVRNSICNSFGMLSVNNRIFFAEYNRRLGNNACKLVRGYMRFIQHH